MTTLAATSSLDLDRADPLAPVRAWLWCVAALIFAMVLVGGATRLMEAGLSITEWKPIAGALPPLGAEAWLSEFEKYKQIPQFAKLFPDMTLGHFKVIYFWEWSHRLLGRVIGLAFALPLAWFWISGRLPRWLKPRLLGLLALGGLQGAVGWWMVVSGLVGRVEVAPERLATHLLLATVTLVAATWLAIALKAAPVEPGARALRGPATALLTLVVCQIGLGALVAGSRAGWTYNTWPLMDGRLIPPVEDLSRLLPFWKNLFENITTVQFDHRMIAYALIVVALWHAWSASRMAAGTKAARRAKALAGLVFAQASLGILTLLLVVPVWAALSHQAVAMMTVMMATIHCARLRER